MNPVTGSWGREVLSIVMNARGYSYRQMRLPRLTLIHVALGWAALSVAAALILPPIDSRVPPNRALEVAFLVCAAILLAASLFAAVKYFLAAWLKVRTVPNKTSYVIWIGLETSAAVGAVVAVIYGLIRHV